MTEKKSYLVQRQGNLLLVRGAVGAAAFVDGLLGMDFLSRYQAIIAVADAEIRFSTD